MEDKEYVVYTHNDKFGNVRYIGSGRLLRANTRYANSSRGHKYRDWVNTNGKLCVNIIQDNLSKVEATDLEISLYLIYKETGLLLNSSIPSHVKKLPSIRELESIFYYDEDSPSCLKWKQDGRNTRANTPAGTVTQHGYYQVSVSKKFFMAHRIVVALHGIEIKDNFVIDHIDGDRLNNKINNLRVISQSDNNRNRKKFKDKEFPVGVRYDRIRNRFIASVSDPSRKTKSGNNAEISKAFSVKSYGYKNALRLAIEARIRLLKYVEEQNNILYSDSHKIIDND